MPTYQYHCEKCKYQMEAFQKITDKPLTECPECHHSTLKRGPGGGIGISFVGSGWYKTDYGAPAKESTEKSSESTPPSGGCCPCGKNKQSCSSPPAETKP